MAASEPMFIVDAHQDIGFNYIEEGRDFLRPALEKRAREDNSPEALRGRGLATLSLPDALRGHIALIFSTLYVCPEWSRFGAKVRYETPDQAHEQALAQVNYYRQLADRDARLMVVRSQSDLDTVLDSWRGEAVPLEERKLGLIILMEGADPIREPRELEMWYHEQGVRIVGPAWSETRYSGGTKRPGPLTALGFELLERMAGLGMLLDLSHLAEKAYYQALDRYPGPLIASHSNPRHFVNSDRMLSDEMITMLAERDGVVGMVPFNRFLVADWKDGTPKEQVTIDHYIGIIDYVCQLTGSARYVGIGSDWDGGFGSESLPYQFDTIADLWLLRDALQERGFKEEEVRSILGGNFVRLTRQALPSSV